MFNRSSKAIELDEDEEEDEEEEEEDDEVDEASFGSVFILSVPFT